MTELIDVKEAYKMKRDIDHYLEQWENTRPEEDPLLKSWKNHIENNYPTPKKCRKRK